jgi:nitrate/TMAO reductase-like tetraheme cytochrome c subunit
MRKFWPIGNREQERAKPDGGSPAPAAAARGRRWPSLTVDLSQRKHRRRLLITLMLCAVGFTALLAGGYKTIEYSESTEFCGGLCHTMTPQATRYEHSPHAQVECAQCHVGPGVSFFVKSKISGMRQLVALATNTYSRPIKSPVHNLRPARETCETCHSPALFKSNVIKSSVHYDNDAENTRVQWAGKRTTRRYLPQIRRRLPARSCASSATPQRPM